MASSSTPQTPQNIPSSQNSQSLPTPKALTPEVLGNEIVTLYVGRKRKQFTIHKKLLCDRCEFFSKAFRGNFPEAETGEMYLPEDNANAFSGLIDYLYRGALPETKDDSDIAVGALLKLYILAEKLCMSVLMDKLCDSLHILSSSARKIFVPYTIAGVYAKTHSGSKLRKYCASLVAGSLAKCHVGKKTTI